MPKKLFIVSDMQFNMIDGRSSLTNMEYIDKAYSDAGYTRPSIIFWNVNGSSTDFPTTVDKHGTVMISGFSPAIMKSILSGCEISPFNIMKETINSERYTKISEALNS